MKSRAAIILTDYRTGGSFLSLCLDSHPLIHCAPAEPLSKTSTWWQHLQSPGPILDIIFSLEMAKVNMLKIIYRQAGAHVWSMLQERETRVIHLVRQNELRASCSFLFHKRIRRQEVPRKGSRRSLHVYKSAAQRNRAPKPMKINPEELLQLMTQRTQVRQKNAQTLSQVGLKTLRVTYQDVTGGERAEARTLRPAMGRRICEFFKVPYRAMRAPTRKVNAYPLWMLISNWPEVKDVIEGTKFKKHLDFEDRWIERDGLWVVKT